jgi:hypothetical protein
VFARAPERIHVTVRLPQAIVANHVHSLAVYRGNETGRAVFTAANTEQEIVLRREFSLRPVGAALAVAAALLWQRRWWPAFVAGASGSLLLPWPIDPAFSEAAIYIVSAYCLFEAFYVRSENLRWVASAVLGVVSGLYASAWL